MAELLRILIDVWGFLFPFRIVSEWQRACYFVHGKFWCEVGPGLKPVIPFFTDVKPVSVVPEIHNTPLQTVSLRDGRTLTFSASITVQVENVRLAYTTVDKYYETTVELAAGILSEALADVEPDRFDPARGKRDRLIEELRDDLDKATAVFGVRIKALRLNNFALGVRTLRLLAEKATLSG